MTGRDQLKRHYSLQEYFLEVDLEDLTHYDTALAEKLTKQPTDLLPLVSVSVLLLFIIRSLRGHC